VLEITSSATTAEINKAYRKVSLAVHPDKNPSPEAQKFFTLLTSISTILKDDNQRKIYDDHAARGIPKWRGTGYYYNRYKPGPIFILGTVLVTGSIIQYITLWGMYLMKRQDVKEATEAVNNLTYSQIKKQLKKTQGTKIDKKTFKNQSNAALLKEAGLDVNIPHPPTLSDLFVFDLVQSILQRFDKKQAEEMKRSGSSESVDVSTANVLLQKSAFERSKIVAKKRQKINDNVEEITDW
jgi:hypothetical protein